MEIRAPRSALLAHLLAQNQLGKEHLEEGHGVVDHHLTHMAVVNRYPKWHPGKWKEVWLKIKQEGLRRCWSCHLSGTDDW